MVTSIANPEWSEVQDNLKPGPTGMDQTGLDRLRFQGQIRTPACRFGVEPLRQNDVYRLLV